MSDNEQHQHHEIRIDMPADSAFASARDAVEKDGVERLPPGSGEVVDGTLSGFDYLRILYKRRWLCLAVFVLTLGSVVMYTFTATPIYEARTQILIETENPNVVSFQEVVDQNKTTLDYYQTQYRILQSRAIARRSIADPFLATNAQLSGGGRQMFDLQSLFNSVVAYVNGKMTGEAYSKSTAVDETPLERRRVDAFLGALSIVPVRNSRLVDIVYSSPDPKFATAAANAIAKAYIEQNLEYRFTASKEASDWLAARMAEQRSAVEASERALQQYREQYDAISLEDRQNIVVQRLEDLNGAVTKAHTERLQKQALFEQLQAARGDAAALDRFPTVLSNGFIQQLKGEIAALQRQQAEMPDTLGERHPTMIKLKASLQSADAKLQAEIAKIAESVRTEYLAAAAQERSLQAALDQQKHEAQELNRRAIDYGVLQRDAATNRQIFDALLQRSKETGISGELRTSNVRVVDAAEEPPWPAYPRKRTNVTYGLLAAALLAGMLGFVIEALDTCLKTPDDIKVQLGLPFLGLVPQLRRREFAKPSPMINHHVPGMFPEALRAIRTNVLFSFAEGSAKTLVITSTAPEEGKTMVAANLAIALAMTSQRVLLVDADMRRPKIHQLFALDQEAGLSNVLIGSAKANDAVKKTTVPKLWVLPAGRVPPNPPELLGSPRFAELMAAFRENFDWVLLDSPPVLAVTDACVLAHTSSAVLFVVGADLVTRGAAKTALEQLDAAGARYIGAVMNRAEIRRHPHYYSRYYRTKYTTSYAVSPGSQPSSAR